ncbi:MAG: SUF system NifU family Fe-S cluster assembly protein [Acidimicrobiia bacterium]|nr:SUF system NifU family Fe-S cluster assembly protein [Acidimicrobiia bacterium]
MSGLEDLYREIILDHYKNPRQRGELEPPARQTKGFNPLCGDEVVVSVLVDDDRIADIRTTGQGCSISQSSASMMSQAVRGLSLDEVAELTTSFKAQLGIRDESGDDGDGSPDGHDHGRDDEAALKQLGELAALKGVMKFPSRIKCATLAWNTLVEALGSEDATERT